ncbi:MULTISPECIES: hypothetical protein [unclassified Streptomyces]|uniref:hypothetical protein n=1 Tax=unclassified Streptomyces TaxID=2593676 RepID=UPI0001C1992F|nr:MULTISPECIES: hypothetical protein [unclassified Streptomyces]MYR68285.1 hypothetical protein [Streptomyces sp. SID4939]MYS02623.1 hypothetical protein [Streptomyces sp. SID4940]MYT66640.1 hypothetical protein [Streptomyces sp. SID8357]MYT83561.1 hypothetical protein [Streptomyces sp. SID8360]MYU34275.1 hypothetical protein [Streptomyces sp. SID8358]MYW35708.1 hypothetical protein [Streptomyces sp. SID1]
MARWGLIVEQNMGYGKGQIWSVEVLGHVDGTRQEALDVLRARAERFEPHHPANPERRELYQEAEGFLLVVKGFWRTFHCRFRVAEQLYDSHPPEPPAAASPEPPPEPPQPARKPRRRTTERKPPRRAPEPDPGPPPVWDADVPQVPSWLGRDDLS